MQQPRTSIEVTEVGLFQQTLPDHVEMLYVKETVFAMLDWAPLIDRTV
jgi:hypothetical protein